MADEESALSKECTDALGVRIVMENYEPSAAQDLQETLSAKLQGTTVLVEPEPPRGAGIGGVEGPVLQELSVYISAHSDLFSAVGGYVATKIADNAIEAIKEYVSRRKKQQDYQVMLYGPDDKLIQVIRTKNGI